MLFKKFLNLIDQTPFRSIVDKRLDIIEKTDPERIYVENIRAFYNLPRFAAKALCELAIKERIFRKKYGLVCPNDDCKRIIRSYDQNEEIDEEITCLPCQLDEHEQATFNSSDLEKVEYYQLRI